MSKKYKILHLTPHLGAGVGTVVLNYLSKVANDPVFAHSVLCLDYANQNAIEVAKNAGFPLSDNMSKKKPEILDLIVDSDIVLIHWWNHPLLYDFLVREQLPASRVIFWAHQKGSPAPNNFTDKILKYPDLFVFTTPLSYKIKEVEDLPSKYKKRLRDIWSTGGIDRVKSLKPKKHRGFNIGYIGNVDYAKMHPDFLDICNQVDIPDVNFIIVGGPNGKQLEKEATHRGIGQKFHFTGFVSEEEKWEYLSQFDVFGYPLAPHHYGSCDQVLQESMAAGVVPVVLANPMESYMVKDGVTGLVAKSKEEYVIKLRELYHNHELRAYLSKNTEEYAIKTFSLEKMENEWNAIFNQVLNTSKTIKVWKMAPKFISPKDVFLESLGSYGDDFISYCNATNDEEKDMAIQKIKKLAQSANWQSETKSSVHQYLSFFPNDEYLSEWSKIMRMEKKLNRMCPICASELGEILYTQNFIVSDNFPLTGSKNGTMTQYIVACDGCGFVFADVELSQKDYDEYYAKFSQNTSVGDKTDTDDYLINIIELICNSDKSKRIIDIGCGSGSLLIDLKSKGFTKLYGIGMSSTITNLLEQSDIKCKTTSITEKNINLAESALFDIVCLISVLEHVYDLNMALSNISTMLKENAYLIILLPDAAYYHKEITNPIHVINIEHINHFDKTSLDNLMKKHGFLSHISDKYVMNTQRTSSTQIACVYKKCTIVADLLKFHFTTESARSVSLLVEKWKAVQINKEIERMVSSQEEIVVYGAGNYTYSMLSDTILKNCNIIAFVDGNPNKQGTHLMGLPVYNPIFLLDFKGTVIVSVAYEPQSIIQYMSKMGLKNKTYVI